MGRFVAYLVFVLIGYCALLLSVCCSDETRGDQPLSFESDIRPMLERYCFDCHSGDLTEADIDLAPFRRKEDIAAGVSVWLKVREMLDTGQMPPRDADRPSDVDTIRLRDWVRQQLADEARRHAGDPGEVVLRRLSNAEYTYSIRDLTGVGSLAPAEQFPVDGAAGEGFTNTGAGLVMSPSLVQKYLDAAKQVAGHVVLLPDGIRFSANTTQADQTNELLANIQEFYRGFTEDGGGQAVNLQGIEFDTNQGGVLPLRRYLQATLEERERLSGGPSNVSDVAKERGLNDRYLKRLWSLLSGEPSQQSPYMTAVQQRWRATSVEELPALLASIEAAQKVLWKFNSIGHIGRQDGPTQWMEPVSPIVDRQEFRIKAVTDNVSDDVRFYLNATGVMNGNDAVGGVWERPRLEYRSDQAELHPPVLLSDVRRLSESVPQLMATELPRTSKYLQTVADIYQNKATVENAAKTEGLRPELLKSWMQLTGLNSQVPPEVTGHFTNRLAKVQGYDAVNGWGADGTPSLLANSSKDDIAFLTLVVPGRGVTIHPSPDQDAVVVWRSPMAGQIQVEGFVADSDDKCGNGAAWKVELVNSSGSSAIADGVFDSGGRQDFHSDSVVSIREGDLVKLIVSARDNNHACDTTHIDLKIRQQDGQQHVWELSSEIVDRVLDANPLADSFGNPNVWHFCVAGGVGDSQRDLIAGSSLETWRQLVQSSAGDVRLAETLSTIQRVAALDQLEGLTTADQQLREKLLDWWGPLQWLEIAKTISNQESNEVGEYGVVIERLAGNSQTRWQEEGHLLSTPGDVIVVKVPRQLGQNAELVTSARLSSNSGEAAMQFHVSTTQPSESTVDPALPVVVRPDSATAKQVLQSMDDFRMLFPPALCYARLVPVDEVVTMTLFYREDQHLQRLMLDEAGVEKLNRLWDELTYVSHEPLKLVVALEQLIQFATQDRQDLVSKFEYLKPSVEERATVFRSRLAETEPIHVQGVLDFANRAWRRPLTHVEQNALRGFYAALRESGVDHSKAVQLMLSRVLTSPAFLYKLETPGETPKQSPVSDIELATRLSYFLWSSVPDAELTAVAMSGELHQEQVLRKQVQRMLRDARTRRMAVHFACQWLHVQDFDQNDDKNEKLYPEFAELRGDMYEETIRFFHDMFQNNGSVLDILDADHTFLNGALAEHYGVSATGGAGWQRVDGVKQQQRGGVLTMATILASQSGASRTSPILRGNWISETLLGERLPRPPANVPQLPDELPEGLTARELIEQHSSNPACAKCHLRIDPYGFALEQYDAIGRVRENEVDTSTTAFDGTRLVGINGLRQYLLTTRRDDVVRQFCRKLLGYALGRGIQLSDEPLLDEMLQNLKTEEYRFNAAVESVILSRQFREIRGSMNVMR